MPVARGTAAQPLAQMASGALRTFFRIAAAWGLSSKETRVLLGNPPESTFYKWKSGKISTVPRDLLERLSYLLGIYKALQILLPVPSAADAWVRKPNTAPLFAGRSALDVMLSGNVADLYLIRQYLDAQRGGWP
jgi:hypothetical protein